MFTCTTIFHVHSRFKTNSELISKVLDRQLRLTIFQSDKFLPTNVTRKPFTQSLPIRLFLDYLAVSHLLVS